MNYLEGLFEKECYKGNLKNIKYLCKLMNNVGECTMNNLSHLLINEKYYVIEFFMSINHNLINDAIFGSVRCDKLKMIEYIWHTYPNEVKKFNIITKDGCLLCIACEHDHVDIIKWIIAKMNNNIGEHRRAIIYLCQWGDVDMLNTIWETSIENRKNFDENAFHVSCLRNRYNVIKWFFDKIPEVSLNKITSTFTSICMSGDIEMTKWLFENYKTLINKDYFLQKNLERLFFRVCECGSIDVAKWLWETFLSKKIFISDDRFDKTFLKVCGIGHLILAKWLLTIGTPSHKKIYEQIFDEAIKCRYDDMSKWILSLKINK